ncbi:carbonic anhydrase [Alkalicoccus urumqiensis]|uniref:carbonic anhydrase n=1 Tax=Alkalicoccus urumqiensis TaxID=1548213 RepID=A0A2P6MIJ8_ALKUR|nr:carbonic anhydrase [Alkalicoccus urumqiensis]PRO66124.1 carbonate dehydratase [Alkalicoccus urumqiensis]
MAEMYQEGNRSFRESRSGSYFEELAAGQAPDAYVLSCCDSRTDPALILNRDLGDLFVHRNVANQAVEADESFTAGLYYALEVLKVNQIIILGHTTCGGVQAAAGGDTFPDALEPWVKHIRSAVPDGENDGKHLERENTAAQVKRVLESAVYRNSTRRVPVHGALFHLDTGEVEWLQD